VLGERSVSVTECEVPLPSEMEEPYDDVMPYSTSELLSVEVAQQMVTVIELTKVTVISDIIISGLNMESLLYPVSDKFVRDTDRTLK
jgi:hypothetical protein